MTVVLGGIGIAVAVALARDGGGVIEILLVLLLFSGIVLRWIAYAVGWQDIWRRSR